MSTRRSKVVFNVPPFTTETIFDDERLRASELILDLKAQLAKKRHDAESEAIERIARLLKAGN
jgi:hypothetical protein